MFLSRTVQDILAHAEGGTEVIAVLDGPSPYEPPPDDPRLHVVQLEESIGQRAATNLAARMSEAKYVMKLDAHCSVSQGFDVAMMADMQPDWTMIPTMYNLHAFDWVCANGHRRYQGPSGPCKECGEPTTMDVLWHAKPNPQTTAMRFDHDLHFQYWAAFEKRQVGDLVETMSLLGACWMLTREKYWELDICDEKHTGWGQQGTEVACKSWLSGGRLVCTRKAWYSHLFRTQGGDFGFPYPMSGRAVEKAREYSRYLWLGNNWNKAIYPLSWLIERFKPIPDWHDESGRDALVRVTDASAIFAATHPFTNPANTVGTAASASNDTSIAQGMSSAADILPHSEAVPGVVNGRDMGRIAASPIVANDMIQLNARIGEGGDQPSVREPVHSDTLTINSASALSGVVKESTVASRRELTSPIPAISDGINLDIGKEPANRGCVEAFHNQDVCHGSIVQQNTANVKVGMVYYTDNLLDETIMAACQRQIKHCANGHEIISVSLKPMDFGRNIVVDAERSILTMYRQILAGLEASTADIVFLAEHDVLYHASHFDFRPPCRDRFYYDGNFWQVDAKTGHALTHVWRSTSGLCAYRELLLEHYRRRVERVEREGYNVRIGHEPGTHGRPERIDDYGHEMWRAEYPSIDIRHGQNLTPAKWRKEDFRSQRYTEGWQESETIPGWGTYKEAINGIT